jgi:hypothetical protein
VRVHADTSASTHMRPRGRAHLPPLSLPPSPPPSLAETVCSPHGRENLCFIFLFLIKKNLLVVAGLERDTIYNFQFSVFGFRFSIPKIPKLPKLRGLHEQSRKKKKVFSA